MVSRRHSSRRGGHLWIFGAEPLLASECRIYVYNLALRLGVPVKGGGLKEGIEVFPRQDRLDGTEYGNAIRASLGVHRRTERRYWFYEADLSPEAQLAYLDGCRAPHGFLPLRIPPSIYRNEGC